MSIQPAPSLSQYGLAYEEILSHHVVMKKRLRHNDAIRVMHRYVVAGVLAGRVGEVSHLHTEGDSMEIGVCLKG